MGQMSKRAPDARGHEWLTVYSLFSRKFMYEHVHIAQRIEEL